MLLLLAALACLRLSGSTEAAAEERSAAQQPGCSACAPAADYAALLSDVDGRIAGMQKLVDQQPGDWLKRERLAGLLMERVGLSGQFADYLSIGKLLDEAFAIAPEGSGPNLLAARYNMSIHRLSQVEPYLERAERKVGLSGLERAAIATLRGEVAFHSGDYAEALKQYRAAAALAPQSSTLSFLAEYHLRTGGWQEALALLQLSEQYVEPDQAQLKAWLKLQRGAMHMESGRYAEALEYFEAAQQEVGNWWLIREHIAEVYELQGRRAEATALLEECVEQSGHPELMDRLAALYLEAAESSSDPQLKARGEKLVRQSRALWERQVEQLPEAAMGHMLSHSLSFETDMQKLCSLAEQNYEARPAGLAAEQLAEAYLKAGRSADARRVLEQCLATPYTTPGLYGLASEVYAEQGERAAAAAFRERCLGLNPLFPGMSKSAASDTWRSSAH
ncbi:tetratricopeptide repeat protein [bacterium]|nr:tetratricopeptide repeat protein [bacterium]